MILQYELMLNDIQIIISIGLHGLASGLFHFSFDL